MLQDSLSMHDDVELAAVESDHACYGIRPPAVVARMTNACEIQCSTMLAARRTVVLHLPI